MSFQPINIDVLTHGGVLNPEVNVYFSDGRIMPGGERIFYDEALRRFAGGGTYYILSMHHIYGSGMENAPVEYVRAHAIAIISNGQIDDSMWYTNFQ